MRVYVTGARGFVGTRLVRHLEGQAHEVAGGEREVDIRDASALQTALRKLGPLPWLKVSSNLIDFFLVSQIF